MIDAFMFIPRLENGYEMLGSAICDQKSVNKDLGEALLYVITTPNLNLSDFLTLGLISKIHPNFKILLEPLTKFLEINMNDTQKDIEKNCRGKKQSSFEFFLF